MSWSVHPGCYSVLYLVIFTIFYQIIFFNNTAWVYRISEVSTLTEVRNQAYGFYMRSCKMHFLYICLMKDELTGKGLQMNDTEQRGWLLSETLCSTSSGQHRNSRRKSASVQHDPFGSNVKTEFWALSCKGKISAWTICWGLNWHEGRLSRICTRNSKGIQGWLHQSAMTPSSSSIMFPALVWKSKLPYSSWKTNSYFC